MKLINFVLTASLFYTLVFVFGCKKTETQPARSNPPTISTKPVANISSTSVVSGGELTNATNITDKGLIWGTDSTFLTVSNTNKSSNGTGPSNFTDTIQNLQPNTTYYVRAYASYASGVAYGAAVKFTTLTPQPTVYIAGYHGSSAAYWKNGKLVSLPNGIKVNSICVVGNDVYAAGEDLSGGTGKAVYWKNGNIVRLTDGTNGTKYAIAKSMQVSGNNVYVAGYEFLNSGYPAPVVKYWKNSTENSLTAGTAYNSGLANSIYVVGSDVYVAGSIANQSIASFVATYWKNGTPVSLSDGTKVIGEAQSIFVVDNDVYVAGKIKPGLGVGGVPIATYWKNGTAISLTNGNRDAAAYSIYVNGSDVYVAGYEEDGSTGLSVAKYWKNGVPFSLTDGTKYASAQSIYVIGSDVYVAGWDSADGYYNTARCWKNGVLLPLEISSNFSYGTSIFVQ